MPEDDAAVGMMQDCFGRRRFKGHRDDMGGVGSFTDDCRTLYVGGLVMKEGVHQRKMVRRHFEEWGEVENVNVIPRLAVAFVRYRLRSNAEFAKVAMENQALDGEEVLNIRWAYDDPNPVARAAIERSNEDAVIAAMKAKGVSLTNAGFTYPTDYRPAVTAPPSKRARIGDAGTHSTSKYPATDYQYPAAPSGPTSG